MEESKPYTTEELLLKEIQYILQRNCDDEKFLRYIISCALSYEKAKNA